ncbi:MAG TPA: agmatine deiminase family protein [Gemmatimonadaceae bacterium]|jgi:agmatine deiminase|nr:agmatine deiminase family protein [Gemmatimonadaceae bacterium]
MRDDAMDARGVVGPSAATETGSARDFPPAPASDATRRSARDAAALQLRMPAEWEPHAATWIAWPHHEPDWPGKLAPIPWVYAEIVRALHRRERVEILCHTEAVREAARQALDAHAVNPAGYRLHVVPNDRVWLRDSGPTGAIDSAGRVHLVNWRFNAWAKYDNYTHDQQVGEAVASITGLPRHVPLRPDTGEPVVLEGGAIETNGQGLFMVTEECLLSDVQARNPGLTREGYEQVFREWLGVRQTIWLGEGCVGDDTHGHVDDIARFVSPDTIVLAYEPDPADDNHARSEDNVRRLELAGAGDGALRVVRLPYPRPVVMQGERLPASYANYYVANGVVLVPTFNDPNDRIALNVLAELMPDREVVGIHAVDLVWGLGTLHCLSQQEPAGVTG